MRLLGKILLYFVVLCWLIRFFLVIPIAILFIAHGELSAGFWKTSVDIGLGFLVFIVIVGCSAEAYDQATIKKPSSHI